MAEQGIKPHPGTAAVLSFLFNGLGQIYNGQIRKGLKVIFFSFLSMLIFIIGSATVIIWMLGGDVSGKILFLGIALFLCGGALVCFLGMYSIFDAYKFAKNQ